MSVKSGSKFIAGNLALKVQDRLFTAIRTLEGSQEYYDIIVPVGATLGFTEGTRLMIIIEGTNTTTTPILRYGSTQLYIVSSTMTTHEAKVGELIDGNLVDMFIKSLSDVKPGTSTAMIYLGRGANDYSFIVNGPRFIGRNLNEKPLVAGLNYYTNLGLPYIEGDILVVNDLDVLSIDTENIKYGKPNFTHTHTFLSNNRPLWQKSSTQIEELAILRDIQELAIADQFVDVLVYTRNTIALMNAIDDMVTGDTCLTLENNTIYNWNGTTWVIQEALDYNLTTDNGKYFDIEDIDGDNSGKAIWNIAEGGRFRVFTDYSSSIDGITIIRNPSSRALEVAKVPNSLTINNLDADGEVVNTISFDGSSPQTFDVIVDFSNYYDKEDIDTYYNEATPGNISKFFTDTDGNIKLQDGNVVAADIVTKTTAGTFLQAQGSEVDASMIAYEDGSIEDFLDKDFAFIDAENDFVIGQKIAGELIATRDWTQNTFLPNNFDLNLVIDAAIQLNSPSAGKTAIRFARKNISSGATNNLDVELPVVSETNNGLVTPAQVATWNTVSNKVDKEHIDNGLTSTIDYQDHTPGIKSTYADRSAEISIFDDGATNGLRASLLSLNITDSLYSGILADKTGVYAFQNEGISKNNAHKIATQGYVEQNVVLQDDIVTDLNNQWSGNKVVLGAFDFTIIGASSATYRQYGSNVATGAEVYYDKAFPIVTASTAGLATAGMFNQVETNRAAIESLQGQGQVGANLPQPPSQSDIQDAWDTAKPTIPSLEGCSVLDMVTGNTWRLLDVEGTLTWVNLGVLGGTGQATNTTTGVVKGSASGRGTIFVENDATMTVNGWDDLTSDVSNIDLALDTLDSNYSGHISDIDPTNTAPHVTTQNRSDWNAGKTTADNAIPKVSAAVNNNLAMWSSGGVLKDSLLQIVTDFTTPTDSQVPTSLATNNAITSAITTHNTSGSSHSTLFGNKVDKSTTINGHELSSDVTVSKSDVGLGNVYNPTAYGGISYGGGAGESGVSFTNLNDLVYTGFYTCFGTTANVPSASYSWYIQHINSNVGNVSATQTAIAYGATTIIYRRNKTSSTWSAWENISPDTKATKLEIPQWHVPYRDIPGTGEPNTSKFASMTTPLIQSILIRDQEGKATFVGGTSADQGIVKSQLDSAMSTKADKIVGGISGNLVKIGSDGNIEDSDFNTSDLGTYLPLGSVFASAVFLDEAAFKQLNGQSITIVGAYNKFAIWLQEQASLGNAPTCTISEYATAMTTYGQCGKFVINTTGSTQSSGGYSVPANSIKLPTITEFIASNNGGLSIGLEQLDVFKSHNHTTTDPGHSHFISRNINYGASGVVTDGSWGGDNAKNITIPNVNTNTNTTGITINNSGDTETRPKNVRYPYYIVVAAGVKTDIEVDIDEVAADLNNISGQIVDIPKMERVETVYDKDNASATYNWGYTSGIINGVTVSGKDFSKYKYLRIYHQVFANLYQSCVDLKYLTTDNNYKGKNAGFANYDIGLGALVFYGESIVNNAKTSITLTTAFYQLLNGNTGGNENYFVYKIEGVY